MSANETTKYDEAQSRKTERAYQSPEIATQRMRTLRALALRAGEHVLDVGVGPGLLAFDMARQVGETGSVTGVDRAPAMIDIARARCAALPHVRIVDGDAARLEFPDASFDAVACTQVLLYVPETAKALAEMHRVLKPGGRVAIVETDWRGLVLGSSFPETTEKMIQGWDAAAASPQLPAALGPLLRRAGFSAVAASAIPILAGDCVPGSYAENMLSSFGKYAVEQGRVDRSEADAWLDDQKRRARSGEFFFCINRFLFTAVRV